MSFLSKTRWSPSHRRTIRRRQVVGCLLMAATLLSWVLASAPPLHAQAASAGTWTPTGSMHEGRELHTATLLQDGRVLVVGGLSVGADRNGTRLASAELYNPAAGTWTPTGSMHQART